MSAVENDRMEPMENYGVECVICGEEGHHVEGHDPAPVRPNTGDTTT